MSLLSGQFSVRIEKIIYQGWGLSHRQDKTIFAPYVIPGEEVSLKIVKQRKKSLWAEPLEIIEPSPLRRQPKCPYFGQCGGCHYQHIEYSAQLDFKRAQVIESLRRIGRLNIDENQVKQVIPSPRTFHYRNKAEFHTFKDKGRLCLGFHNNHGELMEIKGCALLAEPLNDLLSGFHHGEIPERESRVILRVDGQGQASWLTPGADHSKALFEFTVHGKTFRFHAAEFFQVNYSLLPGLVELVVNACALEGDEVVLDGYCGVGLFSLFIAEEADLVIGMELNKQAVYFAEGNASVNDIKNARFVPLPVESALDGLSEKVDVVVIDPPRSGCSKKVLERILRMEVKRLVYVSCDPVTLARDLAILVKGGFTLLEVQPLDLFPQTYHIENIVRLECFTNKCKTKP